ncbi:Peroxidase [Quillaja saponaria]|uniref:Peroxidase n=1 Tax=Quillaja saponaria TaxID=32244 RepID=A0AAD7PLV9_QUISA|nr:Peroxidase [Quillaja saponaria]
MLKVQILLSRIRLSQIQATARNDVMARFHILRGRINNSVAVDELSSSNVHPGVHEVSKLVPEEQDCLNMHNVIEAPPVSGTKNKAEDFEASVMARFHVLKSRIDNSSSVCSEGQLLDVVGFAGNKIDYPTIRNRTDDESLNIEMDYMMMHNRSYSTEKEQGTQSCDTYRISYQLPTYDSSSSDWEHVMKEDFAGQNN